MDKTIEAYNKIAESYHKKLTDKEFWLPELRKFKSLVKGRNIIDVGCGTGRDARWFIDNGFDYLGIDASSEMLRVARREYPDARFIQKSFYDLDFPEEHFDGFWAAASLLHVPKNELSNILQSLKKVLKSGGIGFITVKKIRTISEGLIKQETFGIERYFSFYTIDEMNYVLKENGFQLIESYGRKQSEDDDWICFYVRK